MKTYSYNKEVLTATAQMQMIFNNISIKRNNNTLVVPCVFGQRSRILKALQNPEGSTHKLPLSVLTRGNITRDSNRVASLHHNILKMSDYAAFDPDSISPVPIDIEYKLSIVTKYPDDMDMIMSNFIPFFNKDIYVTSPHPKLENRNIDHQIVWNGSIDSVWPEELSHNENDIQISNTSFIFKTEIFGGSGYLKDPTGIIYTIDLTLSNSTSAINDSYNTSGNNILAGFYPVPYTETFDSYVEKILHIPILTNTDRDEQVFNVFNDIFNTGVKNNDIPTVSGAVLSGANIYKTSYWPLTYSRDNNFDDMTTYLETLSGKDRLTDTI